MIGLPPDPQSGGGCGRPAIGLALGLTAALHGAVLAGLLYLPRAHTGAMAGERVVSVALSPSPSSSPSPSPSPVVPVALPVHRALALPALPQPMIEIAASAPSAAMAAVPNAAPAPPHASAAPSPASSADALSQRYEAVLYARILAQRRPGLRRAGTVLLRFRLDATGRLVSLAVSASSGDGLLDALALAMVRDAAPFPPPPEPLAASQLTFTIPFEFQ